MDSLGNTIVPKRVSNNTMEIRCGSKLIGVVRGGDMVTKKVTKMVRNVQQANGSYKEEEYNHVETGSINTMIEKAKCIVIWMTTVYKSEKFGQLHDIKNY